MNVSRRAGAFGGARVGPLPYTAVGVAKGKNKEEHPRG